jgi:hypothetical protein
LARGMTVALRPIMTTTDFIEITAADLRTTVGGQQAGATQLAERARRLAEDRVTTNCIDNFAPNVDKANACIAGAGEQAFQRTMKQFAPK